MNNNKGNGLKNLVLISQVSISVMVPIFLMVALGVWLDKKFDTWFTVPFIFLGIAAGARNAYLLVMSDIKREKSKSKKAQDVEIDEKVARYNERKSEVKQLEGEEIFEKVERD